MVAEEILMILCVDMGNTDITVGIYADDRLITTFRTATDKKKSSDEYERLLSDFVVNKKLLQENFTGAILCSVVPSLTSTVKKAIAAAFEVEPLIVGKGVKNGLAIRTDNPSEMGADLVADSVGGIVAYGYPLLIADLGTATKLMVIDKSGALIGAVITPGLKLSVMALVGATAQLPDISLERPKKIIGKNTSDSMNSGAIYGTSEMIKGLASEMEKELGYPCKRVVTGGFSSFVKDLLEDFTFNPNLILDGLLAIYQKNEVKKDEK